jgi:hypothetical protein
MHTTKAFYMHITLIYKIYIEMDSIITLNDLVKVDIFDFLATIINLCLLFSHSLVLSYLCVVASGLI